LTFRRHALLIVILQLFRVSAASVFYLALKLMDRVVDRAIYQW